MTISYVGANLSRMHTRRDKTKSWGAIALTLLILSLGLDAADAGVTEFKTYDMMGFDYVPKQHRDKGLEKVPVIYECGFFRRDFVRGVNNCNGYRRDLVNYPVIKKRAQESIGLSVVAINIESEPWNLMDRFNVGNAVANWQALIDEWQKWNPDTKILIYGAMPRVYWALMSKNEVLLQEYVTQAYAIAPLFLQNRGVELWPSAYLDTDKPDTYRLERQWQIDICHRVYKTKCYFSIMPHYRDYTYPVPVKDEEGNEVGQKERMFSMDQNSFLEIMATLKEDGADGFGLWIHNRHLPDDYESLMKAWSWSGGAQGTSRDKELMWMNAVEKFLDAKGLLKRRKNACYSDY